MISIFKQRVAIAEVDRYLSAYPVGREAPLPDGQGTVYSSRVNARKVVMDDPNDAFATVTLVASYSPST